jgi:hypothetical protein
MPSLNRRVSMDELSDSSRATGRAKATGGLTPDTIQYTRRCPDGSSQFEAIRDPCRVHSHPADRWRLKAF